MYVARGAMVFTVYIIFIFVIESLFKGQLVKVDLAGGIRIHSILRTREESFICGFGTSVHF